MISIYDAGCALGSEEACQSARDARAGMIKESSELTEGELARKVRELMAGIEGPATFITREDRRLNGTPAIKR